jgi:hypothetical protein
VHKALPQHYSLVMMQRTQRRPAKPSAPPRVRHEPATIEDAIYAARGLSSELDHQIDIVAGLTGMSVDEVKDHVLRQPPERPQRGTSVIAGTSVVVVERRAARYSSRPAAGSTNSSPAPAFRSRSLPLRP